MSLTILSVAYPFAAVGPDAVGGAEQVLYPLDRALAAAGNRSVVVARRSYATAAAVADGAREFHFLRGHEAGLARSNGLTIVRAGSRDSSLWDGAAFQLEKPRPFASHDVDGTAQPL